MFNVNKIIIIMKNKRVLFYLSIYTLICVRLFNICVIAYTISAIE